MCGSLVADKWIPLRFVLFIPNYSCLLKDGPYACRAGQFRREGIGYKISCQYVVVIAEALIHCNINGCCITDTRLLRTKYTKMTKQMKIAKKMKAKNVTISDTQACVCIRNASRSAKSNCPA